MTVQHIGAGEELALVDLVDRLIDGGVVVNGEVILSLAGVDLVYLGLRLVLAPAGEVQR
jgi:Gas vesicle protein